MAEAFIADIRDTPALALYRFLDACAAHEVRPPSGTGHIIVDAATAAHIARRTGMEGAEDFVYLCLVGVPVKAGWHASRWVMEKIHDDPEFDPIDGLSGWARNRYGNITTAQDRNEARWTVQERRQHGKQHRE